MKKVPNTAPSSSASRVQIRLPPSDDAEHADGQCGDLGVAHEPERAEVPELAVPLARAGPSRSSGARCRSRWIAPCPLRSSVPSRASRLRCEQSQGHRHRDIPHSHVDDLDDLRRERGRDIVIPALVDSRRIPGVVDQRGPLPFSPSGADYGNRPHRVKRRGSPGRPRDRRVRSGPASSANRPTAGRRTGHGCPSRCLARKRQPRSRQATWITRTGGATRASATRAVDVSSQRATSLAKSSVDDELLGGRVATLGDARPPRRRSRRAGEITRLAPSSVPDGVAPHWLTLIHHCPLARALAGYSTSHHRSAATS